MGGSTSLEKAVGKMFRTLHRWKLCLALFGVAAVTAMPAYVLGLEGLQSTLTFAEVTHGRNNIA